MIKQCKYLKQNLIFNIFKMYESEREKQIVQILQNQYRNRQLHKFYKTQQNARKHSQITQDNVRNELMAKISSRNITIRSMVGQLLNIAGGIKISLENMDNDQTNFIVKEINKMQSKEKGQVNIILNKLKILTAKVYGIQSSSFQFTPQCYLGRMRQIIVAENKTIERTIEMRKKVMHVLYELKKSYNIAIYDSLKFYKYYPCVYKEPKRMMLIGSIDKRIMMEFWPTPIYYLNFYSEKLLFINFKPLDFQSELLYCPILYNMVANQVSISQWYINNLYEFDEKWLKSLLKVYVYFINGDRGYSQQKIFVSYLKLAELQHTDKQDITHKKFPSFKYLPDKQQSQSPEKFIKTVKAIRNFIYQLMVWNWLKNVMVDQYDGKKIDIILHNKFRIEITMQSDMPEKLIQPKTNNNIMISQMMQVQFEPQTIKISQSQAFHQVIFQPQLIIKLLLLANEDRNKRRTSKQLKQNIINALRQQLLLILSVKTKYPIIYSKDQTYNGLFFYDQKSNLKSFNSFLQEF